MLSTRSLPLIALFVAALPAHAQDSRAPAHATPPSQHLGGGHVGNSPFAPPEANDQTFVLDQGGGLDTGCSFRSQGPLVFTIRVGRVVGDRARLKQNGLLSEKAILRMPAFDVDFDANIPGINPERDRVFFNDHAVSTTFLTGSDNTWKLNAFEVPIEWVNFPDDPGPGHSPTPADNTIRIDIDTANVGAGEFWCTAIDWAALSIEVARPLVLAHGIFSRGSVWDAVWMPRLEELGLPASNRLNMGALDSISSNGAKIASEVAASKTRWGVDKVVLVGHSKGGIDSRECAELSSSVEQVIQIGTPNGGSPLADIVQAGFVVAGPIGLALDGLVSAIAGPAGLQLTTPYMAVYNAFHGPNSEVRYTALAGSYDPACFVLNPFCRPLQRLLLALSGSPGDTVVPMASVHVLPYTADRNFQSSGSNMDATHSCMLTFTGCQLQSDAVFDQVSDLVRAKGSSSSPFGVASPASPSTATIAGSLAQGESVERTLPIDAASPALFYLLYPSGDLDLVLVSPSGVTIDPLVADVDPDIEHDDGELFDGKLEVYGLLHPEVGVWTLRIRAPIVSDPSGRTGFLAAGVLESHALVLQTEIVEISVSSGEPLVFLGTVLQAGLSVPGATIAAMVATPDGRTLSVGLHDDGISPDGVAGDGLHTGSLDDTTQPGLYSVAFLAEGGGPGTPAFSRQAFGAATVSASSTGIAGTFRDAGVDADGNGLFDRLEIDVDVAVTVGGTYRLFGELKDAHGNRQQASASAVLTPGAHVMTLAFDGRRVFQSGVDGPYELSIVRLAQEQGLAIMPLNELTSAHSTAAYAFTAFEHAPIILTGGGGSIGVDTDGDGLFDRLDVGVEVRLDNADFYNWSARLTDANGTELGFFGGSSFFDEGTHPLQLSFPGEPIGVNGVNGPYAVTDLLLFGGGSSLVAFKALLTDPFQAREFEGFVASGQRGIALLGSARMSGTALALTDAAPGQRAAAWLTRRADLARGFVLDAEIRVSNPGGVADAQGRNGGDGICVVIQDAGLSALGDGAGFLGYQGIPKSLAIEFDLFDNDGFLAEPSGPHVSVQTLGTAPNSAHHSASIASAPIRDLSDGNPHIVRIAYSPRGRLFVFLDDMRVPVLSAAVDLKAHLEVRGGGAYVGFTAATGDAFESHEVLRWSLRMPR